jgi:signal peptidase I
MTSDPIPEEELPPKLRFDRPVKGTDPTDFGSIRSDSAEAADDGPDDLDPADGSGVDGGLLDRFEALKRTLGEEIRPEGDEANVFDAEHGDDLNRRIREARQRELETRARLQEEGVDPELVELSPDEIERRAQEGGLSERELRKNKRRERRKNRSFWAELPILILVALVVAIIIKTFFFQAFYIPSGSMIPTLEINDRVLVNKLSYRFGAIERGDILVFDSPEAIEVERSFASRVVRSIGEATGLTSPDTVLIKRVIALPGETVEIKDNQVYVNGNPIAEPYLPDGTTMRDFDELTIPADHVFMMGDNRNQSRDSRVFGPIPREDIVGRAFVTVWPPGAWGGL